MMMMMASKSFPSSRPHFEVDQITRLAHILTELTVQFSSRLKKYLTMNRTCACVLLISYYSLQLYSRFGATDVNVKLSVFRSNH